MSDSQQPHQDLFVYAYNNLTTELRRATTRVANAMEDFNTAISVAATLSDQSQRRDVLGNASIHFHNALIDNENRIEDRRIALTDIAKKMVEGALDSPQSHTNASVAKLGVSHPEAAQPPEVFEVDAADANADPVGEKNAPIDVDGNDAKPTPKLSRPPSKMEKSSPKLTKQPSKLKKPSPKKQPINANQSDSDSDYKDDDEEEADSSSSSSSFASPSPTKKNRPQLRKRKEEEEESSSSSEGSFVVSSGDEIEVFDDPKYDKIFKGRPPVSKKRVAKKVKFFEVQADDNTRGDNLTLLMDIRKDVGASDNTESAKDFFALLHDGVSLSVAINTSDWFTKRYAEPINMIRQNCGFETSNAPALAIWDAMVDAAFKKEGECKIERVPQSQSSVKCCLCNIKRRIYNNLRLNGESHPIGGTCLQLARAVIEFYSDLHHCVFYTTSDEIAQSIKTLDSTLAKVQKAHALKQNRKKN